DALPIYAGNAVTTLDANNNTLSSVSFRDTGALVVAGITASGAVTLDSPGAVTQTAPILGTTLTLQDTTAGGAATFTLTDAGNAVTTLDANNNTLSSVSFRDTGALVVAGITASGAVAQESAGAVTQTAPILGTTLTLQDTTAGGAATFTLTDAGNAVTTLDANNNTLSSVSFRDTGALVVAGITASGAATLESPGAVTQTAPILGTTLTLQDTTAGGAATFTLTDAGNAVTTLAANHNSLSSVSLRDTGALVVAGITASGAVAQESAGAVTQTAPILGTTLTLQDTTAGGAATFTLTDAGNAVTTLDANNNTLSSVSFRDTGALVVAGITASGAATLESPGAVTQTAPILGTTLTLQDTTAGGAATFTLTDAGNAVTTLAANHNSLSSVSLRDTGALVVAGITASGAVTLDSPGAVTQTAPILGTTLTLQDTTAGGAATFTLTDAGNAITTLDADNNALATLSVTGNSGGFAVAGINVTGNTTLSTTGTVTQTGAIVSAGLELLGVGGTFTLDTVNNTVTTLAGNTGS